MQLNFEMHHSFSYKKHNHMNFILILKWERYLLLSVLRGMFLD